MGKKRIHYLGYYMLPDEKYDGNIPGRLKMDYVINCICEAKPRIEKRIFSLCPARSGICLPVTKKIKENVYLFHPLSLSKKSRLSRGLNKILRYIQVLMYILFHTGRDDTIIVYHTVWLTNCIKKLRRLVKRKFIIEIEEIYGYSATGKLQFADSEIESLKKFDNFIVVNDTLPEVIGIDSKNICVCYGAYNPQKRKTPRFESGQINIVYAGTIEDKKCGVWTAVEIAQYLSNHYVLHIAGFGNPRIVQVLKERIEAINRDSACKIIFHGYLQGEELEQLLWGCHIGLSTYVIDELFSSCSFPSKLTTYVSHDLIVAVCDVSTYKRTALNNNWILYEEDNPEHIADCIMNYRGDFDFSNYDTIHRLHEHFVSWLKNNII
jgi:hypothetical protein